jgi:hypothetical protein
MHEEGTPPTAGHAVTNYAVVLLFERTYDHVEHMFEAIHLAGRAWWAIERAVPASRAAAPPGVTHLMANLCERVEFINAMRAKTYQPAWPLGAMLSNGVVPEVGSNPARWLPRVGTITDATADIRLRLEEVRGALALLGGAVGLAPWILSPRLPGGHLPATLLQEFESELESAAQFAQAVLESCAELSRLMAPWT